MKQALFCLLMLISYQTLFAQKIEFYTPRTVRIVKENGTVFNKKSLVVTAEPEKVKVNVTSNDTATIYRSSELTVIVGKNGISFLFSNSKRTG